MRWRRVPENAEKEEEEEENELEEEDELEEEEKVNSSFPCFRSAGN